MASSRAHLVVSPVVWGVVADTHVPDRASNLHPGLIPALRAAGVSRILHAGDICSPVVLSQLEQVAPVTAVRGNRDWAFHNRLQWTECLEVSGTQVALMHGHGNLLEYLLDKVRYTLAGYRLENYLPQLFKPHPQAQVVVFGHTHRPFNQELHGKLLFNPGSAGLDDPSRNNPCFGLLHFKGNGAVAGEIIPLNGAHLKAHRWVGE